MTEIINSKRRQIALGLPAGLLLPTGLLLPGVAAAKELTDVTTATSWVDGSKAAKSLSAESVFSRPTGLSRVAAVSDLEWYRTNVFAHYLEFDMYWPSVVDLVTASAIVIYNAFYSGVDYDPSSAYSREVFRRQALPQFAQTAQPDLVTALFNKCSVDFLTMALDDAHEPIGSWRNNRYNCLARTWAFVQYINAEKDQVLLAKFRDSYAHMVNQLSNFCAFVSKDFYHKKLFDNAMLVNEISGDRNRSLQLIYDDNVTTRVEGTFPNVTRYYSVNVSSLNFTMPERVDLTPSAHHIERPFEYTPTYSQVVRELYGERNTTKTYVRKNLQRTTWRQYYHNATLWPIQPGQQRGVDKYSDEYVDVNGPFKDLKMDVAQSKLFLRQLSSAIVEQTGEEPYPSTILAIWQAKFIAQSLNAVIRGTLYAGIVDLKEMPYIMDRGQVDAAVRADLFHWDDARRAALIVGASSVGMAAFGIMIANFVLLSEANDYLLANPNATNLSAATHVQMKLTAYVSTITWGTTSVGVCMLNKALVTVCPAEYINLIKAFFGASDFLGAALEAVGHVKKYGPKIKNLSTDKMDAGEWGDLVLGGASMCTRIYSGGMSMLRVVQLVIYGYTEFTFNLGAGIVHKHKTPAMPTAQRNASILTAAYCLMVWMTWNKNPT